MAFLRRVIVVSMMIFFLGIGIQNGYAANICSTTKRLNNPSFTYQELYSVSDKAFQTEYFKTINFPIQWNTTVLGNKLRYNNQLENDSICNNGTFVAGEYDNWNSRRKGQSRLSESKVTDPYGDMSFDDVKKAQQYITSHCGFGLEIDGHIGIKTINSVQACIPPCQGKCTWSDFASLSKAGALYLDKDGKKILYDPSTNKFNAFTIDSQLYVDLTKSNGLVTQDNASTNGLIPIERKTDACTTAFGSVTIPPDAKEEGGKCCYAGNNIEGGPNLNTSWSIQGLNATYTPTIQPTNLITPMPGSITIPVCGTATDTNSAAVCRFKPQAGVTPSTEYMTAKANEVDYKIPTDCNKGCDGGYTEVKKGGIAICEKCSLEKCNCGIKLNTNIPFIGRCIMNEKTNNVGQNGDTTTVNSLNAFPILMGALIKLLMSIIMIVCFASLIVGGFMMTVPDQYDTGKGIVKKVIRTIVALGSLGTILYLINPNFFS